MRVLICGSRDLADYTAIKTVVQAYAHAIVPVVLIEGEAPGADTIARAAAEQWADLGHPITVEKYPADWGKHGRAAGPIRNRQMLVEGKSDVVWAFVNKPLHESRGTYNMVDQAVAAGVPTYVVQAMQ